MHTGDKLEGSVCKCMDCASARYKKVKRETLLRHPAEYRGFEDQLLAAEREIEQWTAKKREAQRQMDDLEEATLKELIGE